jgi:hypothetical protein
MSEVIKPKEGIIYECCKSFTDRFGDRARIGQKFWFSDESGKPFSTLSDDYLMRKISGRGCDIAVSIKDFATYFCPINEQTNTTDEQTATTKFKVGDKVRITKSSEWYDANEDGNSPNPPNVDGEICRIDNYDNLGIYVEWDNGVGNSYSDYDLVLVEQESHDNNQSNQNNMKVLIVVDNAEQIKELAKVPFLKEQIESEFPELFVTHKAGNRYQDQTNGNRYILVGDMIHGDKYVALTNLKTGLVESITVQVNDFNKIIPDEFSMLDFANLELLSERQ